MASLDHPTAHGSVPLHTLPLVFFDVETTGLRPASGDRVCELALLRTRGEQEEDRLHTLVNPQRPVSPGAFAVHHISAAMLADAPPFAALVPSLNSMLHEAVVVAHNAPFDIAFLVHELARLGLPAPRNPVLDTLALARRLMRCSSYSLPALARTLNLPPPNHRALSDVLTLYALFWRLVEHVASTQAPTLDDVLAVAQGVPPGQPPLDAPPLLALALRERRRLRIVYRARTRPEATTRVIQPFELRQERTGIFLRAYCYLREDMRTFALAKIEAMELDDDLPQQGR